MSLTQLVEKINEEKIKKIVVSGNELEVIFKDDKEALSRKETETSLSESLINYGVNKEILKGVEDGSKAEWSPHVVQPSAIQNRSLGDQRESAI